MSTEHLRIVAADVAGGIDGLLRDEFRVDCYVPDRSDPVLCGPPCAVPGCEGLYVPQAKPGLCQGHLKQSKVLQVSPAQFLKVGGHKTFTPKLRFSFEGLPPVLRREYQFGLQSRHDTRQALLRLSAFNRGRKILIESGANSILDRTGADWYQQCGRRGAGSWMKFVYRSVELGSRPKNLLERDYWVASDFPGVRSPRSEKLRLATVELPWLRHAATRWAEWRLNSGRAWGTVILNWEGIRHFDRYLRTSHPGISHRDLNRSVVVGFVGHMKAYGAKRQTLADHVSSVRIFLEEYRVRGDEWGPPLPASAVLRYDDVGVPRKVLPRPIPEDVMRQIEAPENFDRLALHMKALVLVGLRAGLRLASARELKHDCLREDSNGQLSLIYINTKRDRERAIPLVDQDVIDAIRRQQQAVDVRFGTDCEFLFPRTSANPDGSIVFSTSVVRDSLNRWLLECGIVDRDGQPARVTFHQFRHTFATRLIEKGASEIFVSQLLDHKSSATTRGYAQLSDRSKRDEFERLAKVNNRGDVIETVSSMEGTDHEWLKQGVNRMQVSLSNGYCGLPPQQPCEMSNACLDCDEYFITTAEFLPVHQEQLANTRKLIATAESNGQFRMVEKNRPVEAKLVKIISSLERQGLTDDA